MCVREGQTPGEKVWGGGQGVGGAGMGGEQVTWGQSAKEHGSEVRLPALTICLSAACLSLLLLSCCSNRGDGFKMTLQ